MTTEAFISSLFQPFSAGEGFFYCIKICIYIDPACGSGAFPIGILQKVVFILQQADETAELWLKKQLEGISSKELRHDIEEKYKTENYDYLRKLGVIHESIFGVDIQIIATEIAKLRCFLTLIIEERIDETKENRGIKPLPNLDFKFVTANSLVGLPEEATTGQMTFLEDTNHINKLRRIRDDYFTADLDERNKLQFEFISIQNEMFRKTIDEFKKIPSKFYSILSRWRPFESESTDWFDSQWMFGVEKFDIVIANPPYLDSENMVNSGLGSLREYLSKNYAYTNGNWDIYIAFFEFGYRLLSGTGVLTYITPDKWISKPFGESLRSAIVPYISSILISGRDIFTSVLVDSIVTTVGKIPCADIAIYKRNGSVIMPASFVAKKVLSPPFALDVLFSNHIKLIEKLNANTTRLGAKFTCENACATADAYKLKEILYSLETPLEYAEDKHLKIINTGTVARFSSRWGKKSMTYLKDKYLYPVVDRKEFFSQFFNSYAEKAQRPKLIIKGLTLLDACIDEIGCFIPGKTTLMISATGDDLLYLLGIVNSKLTIFYIKEKYSASSYNGGINFNKDMINSIPIVQDVKGRRKIIDKVEQILSLKAKNPDYDTTILEKEIDWVIYEMFGLTYDEIASIETS